MSVLLPCPLCGATIEYPAKHEDANETVMFHPKPETGACILGGYSYGFDLEQWQTRPGEQAARVEVLEGLRKLVDGWVERGWEPSQIRQHLFDRIQTLIDQCEVKG